MTTPASESSPTDRAARRIYTVSELTDEIKELLEAGFSGIWVEGEVSNFTVSSAGHWYFSLKERRAGQEAVLSCALFARATREVRFKLENGLKVVCSGSLNVYAPHGKYNLVVEAVEPKGVGALQLALEQLKKKLEKEGLFAPEHKRPIPYLPSRIGVVTSLSGAAIKDILKVLDRRFRETHIIIRPVRVQGEGAGQDIAQAIAEFDALYDQADTALRADVLIVGRGGGSIEDLWAFNEEVVARAIYGSRIPVISAVGHERDVTVADLVADLRAATPSVAAELVIPRKEDLYGRVQELAASIGQDFSALVAHAADELQDAARRMKTAATHRWELDAGRLRATQNKLTVLNPAVVIPEHIRRLDDLARQIRVRAAHLVGMKAQALRTACEKLASLNPLNILARGYSVTFSQRDNRIVRDAASLRVSDTIRTRLHNGEIISTVEEVRSDG